MCSNPFNAVVVDDDDIVAIELDIGNIASVGDSENPMPMTSELLERPNAANDHGRVHEELAAALRKLAQSERLAAVGLAITAISHEARNELSGLKMGLDLIPMILDDRALLARTLQQLHRHQDHLCRLLEDIQSFSTPVHLQCGPCDLGEVWRKAWSSLESVWSHRQASVQEEVNDVELRVIADAYRLEQVFRNLFENSLAACADPVVIHIALERAIAPKPAISLTIRDNGPGLDDDQRQNVFNAFFTTKNTGAGLGMAIVKRIVQAHGGAIAVGSQTVDGAEFSIVLPAAPPH